MKCRKKLSFLEFILWVFILSLGLTSCTSVRRESFVQPMENFVAGPISFFKDDIQVNIDHVTDTLLQDQIYQGIDPKIRRYNSSCSMEKNQGRLVVTINQSSLWEGIKQKFSLVITGEIYDENKVLLLQETVFVSGQDSILQVSHQNKYLIPLIDSLIEGWKNFTPIKEK